MLSAMRDDTCNVLNVQHISPNSKRRDYSNIPGGGPKRLKNPPTLLKVATTLEKPPPPPPPQKWVRRLTWAEIDASYLEVGPLCDLEISNIWGDSFRSSHISYSMELSINICMISSVFPNSVTYKNLRRYSHWAWISPSFSNNEKTLFRPFW